MTRRKTDWTDYPEIERKPATHQAVDVETGEILWKDTEAGCITWVYCHEATCLVFAYDGRRLGVIDGRDRYKVEPLPQGGQR